MIRRGSEERIDSLNRLLTAPCVVFGVFASSVAWYYEKILQREGDHVRRRR